MLKKFSAIFLTLLLLDSSAFAMRRMMRSVARGFTSGRSRAVYLAESPTTVHPIVRATPMRFYSASPDETFTTARPVVPRRFYVSHSGETIDGLDGMLSGVLRELGSPTPKHFQYDFDNKTFYDRLCKTPGIVREGPVGTSALYRKQILKCNSPTLVRIIANYGTCPEDTKVLNYLLEHSLLDKESQDLRFVLEVRPGYDKIPAEAFSMTAGAIATVAMLYFWKYNIDISLLSLCGLLAIIDWELTFAPERGGVAYRKASSYEYFSSPTYFAAAIGNYEAVGLFLKNGISAKRKFDDLETAILRQRADVFEHLFTLYGVDYIDLISKRLADGNTFLHLAVMHRYPEASLLVNAGANVNATNAELCTPLHCAVLSNNCPAAKVLIENGADPLIEDCYGVTALDLVKRAYNEKYGVYPLLYIGLQTDSRIEMLKIFQEGGWCKDIEIIKTYRDVVGDEDVE